MYKIYAKKLFNGEEILEDRVVVLMKKNIPHWRRYK
jgi:hypothetical protein